MFANIEDVKQELSPHEAAVNDLSDNGALALANALTKYNSNPHSLTTNEMLLIYKALQLAKIKGGQI